jgi:hypothetical protein
MIDALKRFFGQYDSNGLRFSTNQLEEIKNDIPYWPIERQAMYVDQICKNAVDTGTDIMVSIGSVSFPINTTGVGNAAYIALYSQYPQMRTTAKDILNNYKIWHHHFKKS